MTVLNQTIFKFQLIPLISSQNLHYNNDSQDPEIKMMSQLGDINVLINIEYSKTIKDGQAIERFQCKQCKSMTGKFSISLESDIARTYFKNKQVQNNIDATIYIEKYKTWLDFYNQIFDYNSLQELQINRLEKLLKILESLPEAKTKDGNILFKINQKLGEDITIGGRNIHDIKREIIKILLPNFKGW